MAKPIADRPRAYAPRSVAALLAPVVRPAFRRRSPASARLFAEWPSLAGPIAAHAQPRKLQGGTLTLACPGPMALELQHVATQLIERLNAALGAKTVMRLAFVQVAVAVTTQLSTKNPRRDPLAGKTVPEGPVGDALRALAAALR